MTHVEFPVLDEELMREVLPDLHLLAADQDWMNWTDANYLYELPEKWKLSRLARRADGEIVGYALCSHKEGALWLHRLVVGTNHRGQGLGEKLMRELEAIAQANGLQAISLKTPEDNEGAKRFYHRLGFSAGQPVGGYLPMTRARPTSREAAVGIHQPNFLPWLGYFYKIHLSDIFVILDDVAAPSRGYHNRAGVLVQGHQHWLSVPINKSDPTINSIMQADHRWVDKHLKTLQMVYKKTEFFGEYFDALAEQLQNHAGGSLAAMNIKLIEMVCNWLELSPKFYLSSDYALQETADDRLIRLVQLTGGACYISGKGGANYQDPEKFRAAGIELSYSGFKPSPYPQLGAKEFVPGLSVVDALFNIGAEGVRQQFEAMDRVTASG